MSDRRRLDSLSTALVEDILAASDEDILAECAEDGDDPARVASEIRALLETALVRVPDVPKLAAGRAEKDGDEDVPKPKCQPLGQGR